MGELMPELVDIKGEDAMDVPIILPIIIITKITHPDAVVVVLIHVNVDVVPDMYHIFNLEIGPLYHKKNNLKCLTTVACFAMQK